MNLDTEDIYYGGSVHRPPTAILLKAGPLSCRYESGYLRYINAGNTELVRMIYPAVRDHNWGTVSPRISHEKVVQDEGQFEIHYDARYQEGEIDFQAQYHIKGDKEGNIQFEMRGEALSTFRKNRIGFNILHPPEAAGAACVVGHTKSADEKGFFPKYISPHQPFMDIKSIHWEVDGIQAQLNFEGDIFEMEDQRNWTDASFKTYSTPLDIPFPVTVQRGDKIHQTVKLTVENAKIQKHEKAEGLLIELGKERYALPAIGIGQSSEIQQCTAEDLKYLKSIRFAHYRVDITLNQQNADQQWERAVRESHQLDLPLELALYFSEMYAEDELKKLKTWLEKDKPAIKQLLVFSTEHKSTPEKLLQKTLPFLRELLPNVLIGAGTDCFFTELNRNRVPTRGLDFLTYSLNPQVHQFDNQSLVETLQAQSFTVASAKEFANELPIHVSPVTFKMRFNPNATGPEPEVQAGQLPPQVDTRQMSLFGAGWLIGSLKYLTYSGLKSATYFETLGRRGIIQGPHEPLLPEKFKLEKNMLYPMYWVFYWLLQDAHVELIHTESRDSLQLEGLAWEAKGERMMLLANFQPDTLETEVRGWKDQFQLKWLDAENFVLATRKPDEYMTLDWKNVTNKFSLSPYAVCLLK